MNCTSDLIYMLGCEHRTGNRGPGRVTAGENAHHITIWSVLKQGDTLASERNSRYKSTLSAWCQFLGVYSIRFKFCVMSLFYGKLSVSYK